MSYIKELLKSNFGRAIDLREEFPYKIMVDIHWKCPPHVEQFLYDCDGARHVTLIEFIPGGVPMSWGELQFKNPRDAVHYKLMI